MKILVAGAGGFIGHHLAKRLSLQGHEVIGVDLKEPEFESTTCTKFYLKDLRNPQAFSQIFSECHSKDYPIEEVYQLAADMGGAGYVFTGDSDFDIMNNSSLINLNLTGWARQQSTEGKFIPRLFYSSSACMYPEHNQLDPNNLNLAEDSAYPAAPDSEYGWEKLFSERLYLSLARNTPAVVRIARYHNIYGPLGTFTGGKEKAPAAICRKIAEVEDGGGSIEVWGDGKQTRSFLYIDDCVTATIKLMRSNFGQPVNIGSEEMVSINDLVERVSLIAGKSISSVHLMDKPTGVRGRNSDNRLIREVLGWDYEIDLRKGLEETYSWISGMVEKRL